MPGKKTKKKTSKPKAAKRAARPKAKAKAKAKTKPKAKAKAPARKAASKKSAAGSSARRRGGQPATGKPVRTNKTPAPRGARTRTPFAFKPVDRPSPEVEALLVKVYQYAAQELREQEERGRATRADATPERADQFANTRRHLIDAIVQWEDKQGVAR